MDEVRDDHVRKLEEHMTAAFGEAAAKKLFCNDFKTHVKCLDAFKELMTGDELLGVIDLVIKWAFVRAFTSSNTTFFKELLLFIEDMVSYCFDADYEFLEGEGTILLTMLVEKTGVNNATL